MSKIDYLVRWRQPETGGVRSSIIRCSTPWAAADVVLQREQLNQWTTVFGITKLDE